MKSATLILTLTILTLPTFAQEQADKRDFSFKANTLGMTLDQFRSNPSNIHLDQYRKPRKTTRQKEVPRSIHTALF